MPRIKKTKFLPPYGVLSSMIVMYLMSRFLPLMSWQNTRVISYLLMGASFVCILYCAYVFYKHKTEIKPFKESSFLILAWPYTISRNPIYVCMLVFLFGWGLFLQSLSAFLVIPVFAVWIHYTFVLQEEIMLEDRFSDEYLVYKNRVRRWI